MVVFDIGYGARFSENMSGRKTKRRKLCINNTLLWTLMSVHVATPSPPPYADPRLPPELEEVIFKLASLDLVGAEIARLCLVARRVNNCNCTNGQSSAFFWSISRFKQPPPLQHLILRSLTAPISGHQVLYSHSNAFSQLSHLAIESFNELTRSCTAILPHFLSFRTGITLRHLSIRTRMNTNTPGIRGASFVLSRPIFAGITHLSLSRLIAEVIAPEWHGFTSLTHYLVYEPLFELHDSRMLGPWSAAVSPYLDGVVTLQHLVISIPAVFYDPSKFHPFAWEYPIEQREIITIALLQHKLVPWDRTHFTWLDQLWKRVDREAITATPEASEAVRVLRVDWY
ncbi:hypothetical protein DL96DRAFT_1822700 [Flagelloscypha sp. PMI_526]|nr:hypothetical protein DL96DRAFT_1822700 [Flagelloscypha sp. PMI_526]